MKQNYIGPSGQWALSSTIKSQQLPLRVLHDMSFSTCHIEPFHFPGAGFFFSFVLQLTCWIGSLGKPWPLSQRHTSHYGMCHVWVRYALVELCWYYVVHVGPQCIKAISQSRASCQGKEIKRTERISQRQRTGSRSGHFRIGIIPVHDTCRTPCSDLLALEIQVHCSHPSRLGRKAYFNTLLYNFTYNIVYNII